MPFVYSVPMGGEIKQSLIIISIIIIIIITNFSTFLTLNQSGGVSDYHCQLYTRRNALVVNLWFQLLPISKPPFWFPVVVNI